jgi:plastocyanin
MKSTKSMRRATLEFALALGATVVLTLIAQAGGAACAPTVSAPRPRTRTITIPPAAPAEEITIKVTDAGFEPARITVKKDTPVRLTFLRTSDKTCATEVLIPDQHIQKKLPLNERVTIDLTFKQAGEVTFMCGEKMYKGLIIVGQS